MTDFEHIFLFDVDGVIVSPLAYKVGINSSLKFLCKLAGIQNSEELILSDEEIAHMESTGIHDVWDITNIAFAAILKNCAEQLNTVSIESTEIELTAEQALSKLISLTPCAPRPDYISLAEYYRNHGESSHPPDLLSEILIEGLSGNRNQAFFSALINGFMSDTRSPYNSFGTRIFQNIILGSDFTSTYGLGSSYEGPSLLKTIDEVLMTSSSSEKLKALSLDKRIRVAIYTARPSHPPPDIDNTVGYSPEAEIAAQAAKLDIFPLVGMGSMEWLAAQHDEKSEALTKPNLTHSLSAFLAALLNTGDSRTLNLAYRATRSGDAQELRDLSGSKRFRIYVFEDTISGIKPMVRLPELLKAANMEVDVVAFGIARDENKQNALRPLCRGIFPDVNDALDYAVQLISSEK